MAMVRVFVVLGLVLLNVIDFSEAISIAQRPSNEKRSLCNCDDNNDILQSVLEQLEQHSQQNAQIITHLAALAQQLQQVVREEEEEGVCPAVEELKNEFDNFNNQITNKVDSVLAKVCNASTPVTTPSDPVDLLSCGSILEGVPADINQAPDGWILCHMTDPNEELAATLCKDLLTGLSGGLDESSLLTHGGNYGCYKSSSGVQGIHPSLACQDNYQHTTTLDDCSHCNTLGICIRYPDEITVISTTPALVDSLPCGSILEPVPAEEKQAPEGWILCHMTDPTEELAATPCKDLLTGLTGSFDESSLLARGGNYGCWKSSTGMVGINPTRACRPDYQHTTTLDDCSQCNTLGVCIYYPPTP